jgi:hypothetical protein
MQMCSYDFNDPDSIEQIEGIIKGEILAHFRVREMLLKQLDPAIKWQDDLLMHVASTEGEEYWAREQAINKLDPNNNQKHLRVLERIASDDGDEGIRRLAVEKLPFRNRALARIAYSDESKMVRKAAVKRLLAAIEAAISLMM